MFILMRHVDEESPMLQPTQEKIESTTSQKDLEHTAEIQLHGWIEPRQFQFERQANFFPFPLFLHQQRSIRIPLNSPYLS